MSKPYAPRAQSPRYRNGDCPSEVLAIYDSKGSGDRYTVIYRSVTDDGQGGRWLGLRSMNSQPQHPQYGIGMYCEYRAHEIAAFRYREHHKACRWTDLPDEVRACVRLDCEASV